MMHLSCSSAAGFYIPSTLCNNLSALLGESCFWWVETLFVNAAMTVLYVVGRQVVGCSFFGSFVVLPFESRKIIPDVNHVEIFFGL